MPLELHAGDGEGAGRKPPLLVLEKGVHGELFAGLRGMAGAFSLPTRLADYYADAYCRSQELAALAAECAGAAPRFKTTGVRDALARLGEIADELAGRGQKLYAFAD